MLDNLTRRRRRLVAALVVAVVLAGAGAAVVALRPSERDAGPVPVVLVPGYGGSAASLSPVTARLRDAGRKAIPITLPQQGTGDMMRSATALAKVVERTNAGGVDLVGFSAGAVVVRTYLKMLEGASVARHVVLLGAPNHGADLATLVATFDPRLCVAACAQLTRGSSFLERLNAGDETPDGPDYTSIRTALDRIVTPPTSAVLDGALNVRLQDVCRNARASHGDLVRDPLSLGLVIKALDGALDEPPGRADCAELRSLGGGH